MPGYSFWPTVLMVAPLIRGFACVLSVVRNVAKRYVVVKSSMKKHIGLSDAYDCNYPVVL